MLLFFFTSIKCISNVCHRVAKLSVSKMAHNSKTHLTYLSIVIILASGSKMYASAKNITLVNVCQETIWPGIITQGGNYHGDGFTLKPGQSASYNPPDGWSGRIWARTGCNFNNSTSSCKTGSCGSSINCTSPGSLPVTIAEFTLGANVDYYDVSLVDGFNVPVLVRPFNGKGNCSNAGCDGDLRQNCPSDLAHACLQTIPRASSKFALQHPAMRLMTVQVS